MMAITTSNSISVNPHSINGRLIFTLKTCDSSHLTEISAYELKMAIPHPPVDFLSYLELGCFWNERILHGQTVFKLSTLVKISGC